MRFMRPKETTIKSCVPGGKGEIDFLRRVSYMQDLIYMAKLIPQPGN